MKDLEILKLTVPTLDLNECKTLMGGDGYGWNYDDDCGWNYGLPEIIVTPEEEYTDWDDRYSQLEDEFSRTDDPSSSCGGYQTGGGGVENTENNSQGQENTENNSQGQGEYIYACVPVAAFEVLRSAGKVPAGMTWKDLVKDPDLLKETGLNNAEMCDVIDKYFDIIQQDEKKLQGYDRSFVQGFLDAVNEATQNGNSVLTSILVDSNGDDKFDVGHMVVVLGKEDPDSNLPLFKYWDPAGAGGIKLDSEQKVNNRIIQIAIGYWEVTPKATPK